MTTKLYLRIIFDSLITEALLQQGTANVAQTLSFKFKIRALNRQLKKMSYALLTDPTNSDTILTVQVTEPANPPTTGNALYLELHELLTSLEEDAFVLIGGDKSEDEKEAYRTSAHAFRVKLEEFIASF